MHGGILGIIEQVWCNCPMTTGDVLGMGFVFAFAGAVGLFGFAIYKLITEG